MICRTLGIVVTGTVHFILNWILWLWFLKLTETGSVMYSCHKLWSTLQHIFILPKTYPLHVTS
jgi:TM2 domain-containing membrane protein YozV